MGSRIGGRELEGAAKEERGRGEEKEEKVEGGGEGKMKKGVVGLGGESEGEVEEEMA